MPSAFTTTYKGMTNQLKNDVILGYHGKSIKVTAQWDTGATCSCISEDVVRQLFLIATGKVEIKTPSGKDERNTYLVNLSLPNEVDINDLVVVDSEIGLQNIGMLIGMDVINRGDFAVSNYNNETVFTFRLPSSKRADYVVPIKVANIIGQHGKGKRKRNKK